MKRIVALFAATSLLVAGCGDDRTVAGTDEHGNAVSARVLVRDSSGAPAVGVAVEFRPSDWLDGDPLDTASGSSPSRCVTDADGSCPLPHSDAPLSVRAGDGEYAASGTSGISTDSVTRLVLRPTGSVQGRLLGFGRGVVVRVPGLSGRAWTDDSGRFSLGSLPEGIRRLALGGASRMVLDSVPVRPRRALNFEIRVPETTSVLVQVLDTFSLHELPPPPVFSPPGGTYDSILDISFPGLVAGDAVETSDDGIRWNVLNGAIRLMASSCIHARIVRDGRIVSNVSRACYVLAP